MSKEQMMHARDLILQKKFNEARAILEQIDHPTAQQWLAKLDDIAPAAGTDAPTAAPATGVDPEVVKQRMQTARELIMQKQYAEARAILEQIDHPAAQQWLARLDQIAPAAPPAEAEDSAQSKTPPPMSLVTPEPGDALPREEQETQLIEAQELILDSKFEAAQAILDTLTIPEAIIWKHKTQMNKFREFQSLWLDMYYYAVEFSHPSLDQDTWRCPTCGRSLDETSLCPQRGTATCPAKIHERAIHEPHRLALIVGSIYMGQTASIKPMLKNAGVKKVVHWRQELEWQLQRLWEKDVRRGALETAIMLLGQLAESRKLMGQTDDLQSDAIRPLAGTPGTDQPASADAHDHEDDKPKGTFKRLGGLFRGDKE